MSGLIYISAVAGGLFFSNSPGMDFMKQKLRILLILFVIAGVNYPDVASAADDESFDFTVAKKFIETRNADVSDFKKKLENDAFENLDQANAINMKYGNLPAGYVLYRLNLADNIRKNAGNKSRLAKYCDEFVFLDAAEKSYSDNIQSYNEGIAEKFISRDQYLVMGEDQLQKVLAGYLEDNSSIYGFSNPGSIKVSIDKAVPYKAEDGDFGVTYFVQIDSGDASGDGAGYQPFQLRYYHGEIISLEQITDDAADTAVLKLCKQ